MIYPLYKNDKLKILIKIIYKMIQTHLKNIVNIMDQSKNII